MSNLSLNQLRPEQVCERLGCCRAQLYKLVDNDPTFPKPIQVTKRWIFWYECEIDAWTRKKAAEQQGLSIEAMTERLASASAFSMKFKELMAN